MTVASQAPGQPADELLRPVGRPVRADEPPRGNCDGGGYIVEVCLDVGGGPADIAAWCAVAGGPRGHSHLRSNPAQGSRVRGRVTTRCHDGSGNHGRGPCRPLTLLVCRELLPGDEFRNAGGVMPPADRPCPPEVGSAACRSLSGRRSHACGPPMKESGRSLWRWDARRPPSAASRPVALFAARAATAPRWLKPRQMSGRGVRRRRCWRPAGAPPTSRSGQSPGTGNPNVDVQAA